MLWFNVEKGFGFLRLSDGSDAFLHASRLQAAGHDTLPEGTRLTVRTIMGQKGPQVEEVVSVESVETPDTVSPAKQRGSSISRASTATGPHEQEGTGVVKRYDPAKGFGFIAMEGGVKDIFVHATALTRSGVGALESGQKVSITYSEGQKGLEARSVRIR